VIDGKTYLPISVDNKPKKRKITANSKNITIKKNSKSAKNKKKEPQVF
jgi:hypothetical protein